MMKKMSVSHQRLLLLCACIPIYLLSAWCSEAASADKELTKLRITALPFFSFAPLYIAEAEGFFAEQGLAVEFVRFQSNADSLPALLRGDIDIDTIFTVGVLNAVSRGETIRVVAARGTLTQNDCPVDGFLVRPDRAAEFGTLKAEDLRTLTFGVDRTWLDSYFLQQWLIERGLTLKDVRTEYLPSPAARVEALRQGALDMAFMSEPWITLAREGKAGEVYLPASKLAPGYPFSAIMFGPSILSRDDDAGARFLRAYLRAVAQYAEGKTERNIEILAKVTQLQPDLLRRICWPVIPLDGKIDAAAIAAYSAWAVEQGLADRSLSPDEIWAPQYLNEALKQ